MNKIQSRLTSFHLTALWASLKPLSLFSPPLSFSSLSLFIFLSLSPGVMAQLPFFTLRLQKGTKWSRVLWKIDGKKKRLLIFYFPSLSEFTELCSELHQYFFFKISMQEVSYGQIQWAQCLMKEEGPKLWNIMKSISSKLFILQERS